jgi:hypothetical protein
VLVQTRRLSAQRPPSVCCLRLPQQHSSHLLLQPQAFSYR